MKPLTTREVMFGMISLNTIGSDPSPENFAAVTNSRKRRVMICARFPRRAGPAGDADDEDHQPQTPDLAVRDDHHHQWQHRDDESQVGEEGQEVVQEFPSA